MNAPSQLKALIARKGVQYIYRCNRKKIQGTFRKGQTPPFLRPFLVVQTLGFSLPSLGPGQTFCDERYRCEMERFKWPHFERRLAIFELFFEYVKLMGNCVNRQQSFQTLNIQAVYSYSQAQTMTFISFFFIMTEVHFQVSRNTYLSMQN